MTPDNETWGRLNAYCDGELDPVATAALEARLSDDPRLRAELEEIREISSALKSLHPSRSVAPTRHASAWPARASLAAAMAASLALLFGAYQIWPSSAESNPHDWHYTFADRAYSVQQTESVKPVAHWMAQDFDLTSADLTLVDVAILDNGDVYLHYAGVNGCRLTFGAFTGPPVLPVAVDGIDAQSWSVGRVYYSLLAEGMDAGRFAAIHKLLLDMTNYHRKNTETLMAVRAATEKAAPCA